MTFLRFLLLIIAAALAAAPAAAQKRIALTFDDVPRDRGAFLTHDERTVKLIAALERAKVEQAAFFVTAGFLEDPDRRGGEDRITAYTAAGHVLANHSYTHPHLSELSAADYLANLDKTEAWLKGRPGRRPWFRHPYLDEGGADKAKRDAVRAGLKARGLRNGYVTVDGADWHLEMLTQEAGRAGKTMDMNALRDLYVTTHVEAANFNHALARQLMKRSPAHVLLLHETDIAALFIEDLVEALRKDGWEIVTADKAFADPLKREMPDPAVTSGGLLHQMVQARGLKIETWPPTAGQNVQKRLFAERVLKEAVAP
jgi:peptidoglycan/xylan/chitin deacetylase (PgdA/CDA1 family)